MLRMIHYTGVVYREGVHIDKVSCYFMPKRAKWDTEVNRQMQSLQAKASYYKKEAPKAREIIKLSKDDHNDTVHIFCETDSNHIEDNFTEEIKLLWKAQREN